MDIHSENLLIVFGLGESRFGIIDVDPHHLNFSFSFYGTYVVLDSHMHQLNNGSKEIIKKSKYCN